jgi:hypothetical protein
MNAGIMTLFFSGDRRILTPFHTYFMHLHGRMAHVVPSNETHNQLQEQMHIVLLCVDVILASMYEGAPVTLPITSEEKNLPAYARTCALLDVVYNALARQLFKAYKEQEMVYKTYLDYLAERIKAETRALEANKDPENINFYKQNVEQAKEKHRGLQACKDNLVMKDPTGWFKYKVFVDAILKKFITLKKKVATVYHILYNTMFYREEEHVEPVFILKHMFVGGPNACDYYTYYKRFSFQRFSFGLFTCKSEVPCEDGPQFVRKLIEMSTSACEALTTLAKIDHPILVDDPIQCVNNLLTYSKQKRVCNLDEQIEFLCCPFFYCLNCRAHLKINYQDMENIPYFQCIFRITPVEGQTTCKVVDPFETDRELNTLLAPSNLGGVNELIYKTVGNVVETHCNHVSPNLNKDFIHKLMEHVEPDTTLIQNKTTGEWESCPSSSGIYYQTFPQLRPPMCLIFIIQPGITSQSDVFDPLVGVNKRRIFLGFQEHVHLNRIRGYEAYVDVVYSLSSVMIHVHNHFVCYRRMNNNTWVYLDDLLPQTNIAIYPTCHEMLDAMKKQYDEWIDVERVVPCLSMYERL